MKTIAIYKPCLMIAILTGMRWYLNVVLIYGEIGTLLHCWWKCKLVQPLWKTVWRLLKDAEPEIPFDSAVPLLDIYPKDYKLFYHKNTCTHMFTVALFTIAKTWSQPKCPSVDKENMTHTHHGILWSHKKG